MLSVNEKITELRKLMAERNMDVYYVPNEDDHLSMEYTATYFQCKSWLSGFSGDAGCVVVTKDFAGLWTDGRYFTQAEDELAGTCVTLMRMRQPGVPTALEFLVDAVPENGKLGFDGSVVSARDALFLSNALKKKHAVLHVEEDLVGMLWEERPSMPASKLYVLPEKYTGEGAVDKIRRVREEMKKNNADAMILTALEDPCWLLNIRADDIYCTPVCYAFAMISMDAVNYYVDENKVNADVQSYFDEIGVTVRPYTDLGTDLSTLHGKNIWTDLGSLNAKLYSSLASDNTILNKALPIERFRAIKNETEIRNTKHAHLKDAVAMVRFIKWVKEQAPTGTLSELSAQNYLYDRRAEQADYIEPSFPTIAAYQANGAMMHYEASEQKYAHIDPHGFLLVDSGGTYKDGSTDITRTIAVGPLNDMEKMLYTKVLKGHLDLANAHFLYGTAGTNLDILARRPLWDMNIDYQCGTGHGVGHVLGVHEGPHGVRWGRPRNKEEAIFEPGMVVTDEPGVYLPHQLGIRIENELLVVKGEQNFYGQFLYFENLTWVPYDLDAIEPRYLSKDNIDEINRYHAHVYELLAPLLSEEERAWLKKETRPII